MRHLVLALAVTLSFALAGPARAADPVFPRGAAVGLVPPPGMVESNHFTGFEDRARNAALLVVEMPPEAYEQIAAGFTDAGLAAKGITVSSRADLPVAGGRGEMIVSTQNRGPVSVRQWVLIAGTPQATALVTLQMPADQADIFSDDTVKAAFATLAFRSVQEQLDTLPFVLSDLAGFRLARTLGGAAALLTDASTPIDAADKPMVMVNVGAGAPRDDERRQFALRAFSNVPGVKDMKLQRAEPLRVAGQSGYEIMADGVDANTGTPVKVVQWLRFSPTAHLRMLAVVPQSAFTDLYPRLRTLRDGIGSR